MCLSVHARICGGCTSVHTWRPEEGVKSHGAVVRGICGCRICYECWDPNSGPRDWLCSKHSTKEPSLQLLYFFFLRKPVPTVRWNREGVRMDPGWSSSSPVKKFIAGVWEGCEGGLPQKAPHVINHCSVVYLNIPRIIL